MMAVTVALGQTLDSLGLEDPDLGQHWLIAFVHVWCLSLPAMPGLAHQKITGQGWQLWPILSLLVYWYHWLSRMGMSKSDFPFLHFYYKCHLHEGENFLNFLFLWCWENGKNSLVALHLICVMHVWDVMGLNAPGALSLLPDVWPLWMGHST